MILSPLLDERVLIVAPTGSDAQNTRDVLTQAGFSAEIYAHLASAAEEIQRGCGLLVMTEESLYSTHRAILTGTLERQPEWSNVPIVLITSAGNRRPLPQERHGFEARTQLMMLERPLHIVTLLAAVKSAWRTRLQQYEVRDLIFERERLLSSLELRVAERTTKLQSMVHEMEAFSYSVSHDLRAPLRVLDGYARALQEDYSEQLPAPAHRLLDKISNAAQRMDRLTQDLLAYTRIVNTDVALESVNLDQVFEDVIESYPSLREARNFILLQAPLGVVVGHAPSLVQCFSNLLENAVKFSGPGSKPEIEIRSAPHDGWLRVTVADKGIGLAPSEKERIFGLFERGGDPKTPGTGIGLAIVKKAAERMKGKVGVSSTLGHGCQFWIDLKAAETP